MTLSLTGELKALRQLLKESPTFEPIEWYDATKDISEHPWLRGDISRFIWRLLEYRVTVTARYLVGLTFVLLLYASSSLDLQVFVPFLYVGALWLVVWTAVKLVKPQLSIHFDYPDRVAAGEIATVNIQARHIGRWPGIDLVAMPYRLPQQIDALPITGEKLPPLVPGEPAEIRMRLRCKRRGVYNLHGIRVQTDFPFGVWRAHVIFEESHRLLVIPSYPNLSRLDVPVGERYQPGGVALASNLGETLEYIGNREYRSGDNVRDIDWRATARLDRPVIREYREEYFHRVAVVLDTHVTANRRKEAREDLERAVSLCASVSDYMSHMDYLVDIFAAGPNLFHLSAGRSLAYLDQILDILACVQESPVEPFSTIEPELLESLVTTTTVICIMLDWNAVRAEFVARLRQAGASIKLIIVRDADCTLNASDVPVVSGYVPHIRSIDYAQGIHAL